MAYLRALVNLLIKIDQCMKVILSKAKHLAMEPFNNKMDNCIKVSGEKTIKMG
jgi:hypothetical protein